LQPSIGVTDRPNTYQKFKQIAALWPLAVIGLGIAVTSAGTADRTLLIRRRHLRLRVGICARPMTLLATRFQLEEVAGKARIADPNGGVRVTDAFGEKRNRCRALAG
jgi:hypothetical protein